MDAIIQESYNDVAIIKLNQGFTNPLDMRLISELSGTINVIKENPRINSLVLASANDKFFSIGLDIPNLFGLSKGEFASFFHKFNRLCLDIYTLPKPSIASISGHAIAGGCILALCCDYRFISEGRKLMGLNEVRLGVPVPYPADCILRNLAGTRTAREMMEGGEFFQPEALLKMGVVDQVMSQEQVLPAAIAKASALGVLPPQAFALIKGNRIEAVHTQILANIEEQERIFVECWYSEQTREALKKAMEKF